MKCLLIAGLLLLCSHAGWAAAEESPAIIDVQATTFKVTGHGLVLSLLQQPTMDDQAIFTHLAGMVQVGSAGLAASYHLKALSGQPAKAKSLKEQPFPVDWVRMRRPEELCPSEFDYKYCGQSLTAQLVAHQNPRPDGMPGLITGTFEIESVRGDELTRWPVSLPHRPADGGIDSMQWDTKRSITPFWSTDRRHHLLSVLQIPGAPGKEPPAYYFSFGRAIPAMKDRPRQPAVLSPLMRLHALTFQLNPVQGRQLLSSRKNGGDRPLLESLLKAMAQGTAQLTHQAMLQVDPAKRQTRPWSPADPFLAGPGGDPSAQSPSEPDPFSTLSTGGDASLAASKCEAIREFAYPTEFNDELHPKSFEYKNLGHSFQATVLESHDPYRIPLTMVMEHVREPTMKAWPESGGERIPRIFQPNFYTSTVSTTLEVSPGGVYCLGAIVLPDYFGAPTSRGRLMEISMLKVDGESGKTSPQTSSSYIEIQSERISVSEEAAGALSYLIQTPADAMDYLGTELESGTAHLLALCLLPNPEAPSSEISAMAELSFPNRVKWSNTKQLTPFDLHFQTAGTSLKQSEGLRFRHDIAPFTDRITTEILTEAATSRKELDREPRWYSWEMPCPHEGANLQISLPEKIDVPAGHAEEGRWQVSVIRRR